MFDQAANLYLISYQDTIKFQTWKMRMKILAFMESVSFVPTTNQKYATSIWHASSDLPASLPSPRSEVTIFLFALAWAPKLSNFSLLSVSQAVVLWAFMPFPYSCTTALHCTFDPELCSRLQSGFVITSLRSLYVSSRKTLLTWILLISPLRPRNPKAFSVVISRFHLKQHVCRE